MKVTQEEYIERAQEIFEAVRSANWGVRGVAKALVKNDYGCEIEEVGKLSGQDIADLHCAVLSLSKYVDESLEWIDTATVEKAVRS